nr:adenylosuccinate synthetase [Longispora albida]
MRRAARTGGRGARHTVVADLGYGDAGKGTVVDALSADGGLSAVIRFNGGAQAAHNVVTGDGRHHTFSQFGSGSFHGVPTHLSRHVVADPLALAAEAEHLASAGVPDPFRLITVDGEALLATVWHRAANQERERRRGAGRHGSCGMGIGETMAYALANPDAPRVADTLSPAVLRRKLTAVRDRFADELGELGTPPLDDVVDVLTAFADTVSIVDGQSAVRRLLGSGPCVFEGAQGVLLDEWYGWHPYTTWSTTTFANAEELLAEAGHEACRLGVVRTYTTRHGAGPLVTEDAALTAALPDPHNGTGLWQGAFRAGHFDAVAHRYAVEVAGGVDGLAITHLDIPARLASRAGGPSLAICTSYADGWDRIIPGTRGDLAYQEELATRLAAASPGTLERPGHAGDFAAAISGLLGAPVALESHGPRAADKIRRA